MTFTSSNASNLNQMIQLADDCELVGIIKTAIDYFSINLKGDNALRCAEFKLVASKALVAIKDPSLLKAWLPKVKGLVYTESRLID